MINAMDSSYTTAPAVIRMFPDYADTVLWLGGPIDYPLTGLSEALIAELKAWERSFYDSPNRRHAGASRGLEEKFIRTGVALAKKLTTELGSGFIIEYDAAAALKEPTRYQCPGSAANPHAAVACGLLVARRRREDAELAESARDGQLYACAPRSGAVFDPGGVLAERRHRHKPARPRKK